MADEFDYDTAMANLMRGREWITELENQFKAAGASPQEAKVAAAEVAASPPVSNPTLRPSRMQPPDATGVRAGQMGLPPLPNIPRNALAGELTSTNTPMGDLVGAYDTGLGALTSRVERGAGLVGRGATELTGIPQAVRAGEAVGEALAEPSIPNIGNAGFQAGMAVFKPGKALIAGGTGLAAAAAKDMGMFDTEAQAQRAPKQAPKAPELPGLNPEQNAEYNKLSQTLARDGWMPPAQVQRMKELSAVSNKFVEENAASDRRMKEDEARRLGEAEASRLADERAAEAKRKEDERLAYNTAVTRAETSRDEILNRAKSKRFEEGDTGKLYNKLGMGTPALMAGAAGLATRAFGAGGYVAPMVTGSVAGLAGAHWPLGHEVFFAPVTNPEKDAYQAYSRDLPPTHPRKQEFSDYAERLPELNPAREQAVKEFYDPLKFAERSFIGGALEGPISGLLGAELANAPKVILKGIASSPGEAMAAYRNSMAKADIAQARREGAANRLAGVRADAADAGRKGQLLDEAASLEKNALAGDSAAASAAPATGQASSVPFVEPNALATGRLRATPGMSATASAPGQPLGSEALSNRSPSEILGSIKPPPREVPTSFPEKAPQQPKSGEKDLPPHVKMDANGVYYDERTGHKIPRKFYRSMGIEE